MKPVRLVAVAAFSLSLGALGIAHSMPQDPASEQEASQAQAPEEEVATEETPDADVAAHKPGFLDLRRVAPITGDAAAGKVKAETCHACHGENGIAIAPNIPNLAGQNINYQYWELLQYHRGDRPDSPMSAMVPEGTTDQDLRDMSAYYASLRPSGRNPVTDPDTPPPDPQVLALGEKLYMEGDLAKGIPACQGCHGADARGHPLAAVKDRSGNLPYALYPALRGQQQYFLLTRMIAFHEGGMFDSTSERLMVPISKRLDQDSVMALSAWLSNLPH